MGTANFSVGQYGKNRGSGAATLLSTSVRTSGAHTTSASASSLADAGGAISLAAGEILTISCTAACRINFGGTAATATTGHYIAADVEKQFECNDPGAVSIIEA